MHSINSLTYESRHPEIRGRRTLAIISHPDAGKTTLTETLLLMGGAIRMAGQVRARAQARRTRSDWMKIEKERGISVSSAVMTFCFENTVCNLLDTPGHEDFSEDTYRTLTAADSAIMVLDAARGIQPQTLKLFEVCRLRDIPIITLVNKIDQEGRSPLALLDEIGDRLALDTVPMTWPAGTGGLLRGVCDVGREMFTPWQKQEGVGEPVSLHSTALDRHVPASEREALREDIALAREAYPDFDMELFRAGALTPVYFGSALRNLGVREVLQSVVSHAPSPRPRKTATRVLAPDEKKVSGFVFKVQANMDANHRDRIAFMRLCSGQFRRGMKLKLSGSGKSIGIHNPVFFFAQDREIVDEAWPGDIIGIPNHGAIRVGDTLSEGGEIVFTGIPDFAPEILRRVQLADPMKAKHLRRALESLAEEGVTQVFRPQLDSSWIVGVVGQLQLDVLKERIQVEYGVAVELELSSFATARWVSAKEDARLKAFVESNRAHIAQDRDNFPVFMARNAWELDYTMEKWPEIGFSAIRERQRLDTP